jgi:hypothetical protein
MISADGSARPMNDIRMAGPLHWLSKGISDPVADQGVPAPPLEGLHSRGMVGTSL